MVQFTSISSKHIPLPYHKKHIKKNIDIVPYRIPQKYQTN